MSGIVNSIVPKTNEIANALIITHRTDGKVFKMVEDKLICDGTTSDAIKNRRCYMPMSTYWGGTFKLEQG